MPSKSIQTKIIESFDKFKISISQSEDYVSQVGPTGPNGQTGATGQTGQTGPTGA